MSTTGLTLFDRTIHTTNVWLGDIMDVFGPDRHVAWHILGAVLHTLRDRLTLEQNAHFAAQLPLLIRGLFFDRWHPQQGKEKIRTQAAFLERVQTELKTTRPLNTAEAARTVFQVLSRHLDQGEVRKIVETLPEDIRQLWGTV